jgi:hypothetical protein
MTTIKKITKKQRLQRIRSWFKFRLIGIKCFDVAKENRELFDEVELKLCQEIQVRIEELIRIHDGISENKGLNIKNK